MAAVHARLTSLAPLSRATWSRGASRLVSRVRTAPRSPLKRPTAPRNLSVVSLRQPSLAAPLYYGKDNSSFMCSKKSWEFFDDFGDVSMYEMHAKKDVHSSQASLFMKDHANWHSCDIGNTFSEDEVAYDEPLNSLLSVVQAASIASAEGVVTMQLSQLGDPAILARLSTCLTEMAWHLRHQGIGHCYRSAATANNPNSQCFNQAFTLDFDAFAMGWRKLFRVRSDRDLRELFDRIDGDCDGFVSCKDICSALRPSEINALAHQRGEQSPIYKAALTEDEMLTYRDLIDRARSALDLAHWKGVKIVVATERAEWQPAVAHIVVFPQRIYNTGRQVVASQTK